MLKRIKKADIWLGFRPLKILRLERGNCLFYKTLLVITDHREACADKFKAAAILVPGKTPQIAGQCPATPKHGMPAKNYIIKSSKSVFIII